MNIRSVLCGTETMLYLGPKIWNLLPNDTKNTTSITESKTITPYTTWEDIFKLGAYATACEYCEWVQVEIDVYIPHRKHQVNSQSSPWFPAACAAANLKVFCLH